jgi:hypothetical protein
MGPHALMRPHLSCVPMSSSLLILISTRLARLLFKDKDAHTEKFAGGDLKVVGDLAAELALKGGRQVRDGRIHEGLDVDVHA